MRYELHGDKEVEMGPDNPWHSSWTSSLSLFPNNEQLLSFTAQWSISFQNSWKWKLQNSCYFSFHNNDLAFAVILMKTTVKLMNKIKTLPTNKNRDRNRKAGERKQKAIKKIKHISTYFRCTD